MYSEESDRKEERNKRKEAQRRDRSKYKKSDFKKWEKGVQDEAKTRSQSDLRDQLRGRVIAIGLTEIQVDVNSITYTCILKGSLKKMRGRAKNLITVGDFVLFDPKTGHINFIEERRSFLSKSRHLDQKEQLIASNIDQVLITVSLISPPLVPSLVDRYVIATRRGRMEPIILINKIDLLEDHPDEKRLYKQFKEDYSAQGIPVLGLSAQTGEGMDHLKEVMKTRSSVFVGESGVGKTSLINAVTELELPIGPVGVKTLRGKHTTTSARLVPLICGGWCIDTPGIQRFGLWDLKREDLESYFSEIHEIGMSCHFPNCTHTHEPHCAVREALAAQELSPLRFESYRKLLAEIQNF